MDARTTGTVAEPDRRSIASAGENHLGPLAPAQASVGPHVALCFLAFFELGSNRARF